MELDLKRLAEPFPPTDIEWRIQSAGKKGDRVWAKVIAYITNRAIEDRLDDVCGPGGWQNEFREWGLGTPGVLCKIGILINGHWVWKEDGAEQPKEKAEGQPVAVKGGFSAAMKRAGAQWGIGRYLYDLTEGFATIVEQGHTDARYAKTKGGRDGSPGEPFYWIPPKLPRWALPIVEEPATPKAQALTPTARAVAPAPAPAPPPAASSANGRGMSTLALDKVKAGLMPIGQRKDQLLTTIETGDLESARTWCWNNGGTAKWRPLIDAVTAVLDDRKGLPLPLDPGTPVAAGFDRMPAALEREDDDDLPF